MIIAKESHPALYEAMLAHERELWKAKLDCAERRAGFAENNLAISVAKERERCAKIADAYADENRRMASDSILLDPVFSGADLSPEAFAKSDGMTIDMCVASSMMHAAQNIAAEIRRGQP